MILFLAILLIGLLSAGFFYFISPVSKSNDGVMINIEKGEGASAIANKLKSDGLIRSELLFKIVAKINNKSDKLAYGQFSLKKNLDLISLIDYLADNKNADLEKTVIIREGWTDRQIASYLEAQGVMTAKEFLAAAVVSKWRGKYDFLSEVKGDNLEGFLFPDTYRLFKDAKPEDLITKMLDNFDHKFTLDLREEADNSGIGFYKTLTLASIVEREATADNRAMVADVFLKRLKINMALQSDATVNYVTGKSELRPSYNDLAVDSKYNTYKYPGLPPTPISNPGLDSIRAVIYPKANDYYYFLMDKNGVTHFAKTFQEHQANTAKYLD